MESIPAVFVVGSTVNKINVSVQNGQSPWMGSPPRSPTNNMLIRLPPSHVGYWKSSESRNSGVEVGSGVFWPRTNSVSSGLTASPAQFSAGIPGKEVRRQQIVKDRTKIKRPTALTRARPQNRIWRTGNRPKLILGMLCSLERSGRTPHDSGLTYTIFDLNVAQSISWLVIKCHCESICSRADSG